MVQKARARSLERKHKKAGEGEKRAADEAAMLEERRKAAERKRAEQEERQRQRLAKEGVALPADGGMGDMAGMAARLDGEGGDAAGAEGMTPLFIAKPSLGAADGAAEEEGASSAASGAPTFTLRLPESPGAARSAPGARHAQPRAHTPLPLPPPLRSALAACARTPPLCPTRAPGPPTVSSRQHRRP